MKATLSRPNVIVASVILTVCGVFTVAAVAAPATPWCNYPDPASVSALRAEVDRRVAEIQANSPGQPVDRLTLEMETLSICAGI